MKYRLFDFQQDAVSQLLKKMDSMQNSYQNDGSLSAVSLTAPTGAGKTVISAAVAEGLFYGNDSYPGDADAAILWLSDSPALNKQTKNKFINACDLLNESVLEEIGPTFAKNHRKLMPGHVYFLNRQLLGKGKTLSNEVEGTRSFYDVLNDTIEDTDIHLYLFIDEAHRGLGKSGRDKGTSDSANKTIYGIIIDGQENINLPMPCVVGVSATPERFNNAMNGRKNRDMKAGVNVPVSAVRASGLIKDTIELRTPKMAANTKHQDLTQACRKLAESSRLWKKYCTDKKVFPVITPLMVIQVEDKVSKETLEELCLQIHKILPWLDISSCFANVFGAHEDITTAAGKIPYVSPENVEEKTEIRVLFAKDAVSTGWDCPRAEVIYSRRKRNDPTYIAQLIGRMIRTPLARRVDAVEELNTVACYLPEYDATTVNLVVDKLKQDNIVSDEGTHILTNAADVHFYGDTRKKVEQKISKVHSASAGALHDVPNTETSSPALTDDVSPYAAGTTRVNANESVEDISNVANSGSTNTAADEFPVADDEFSVSMDDLPDSEKELQDILDRVPNALVDDIRTSFEGIITRQVRHDKPDPFLDLWDCVDVLSADIDPDANLDAKIQSSFFNELEGDILHHPAEFKRAVNDIKNTTVSVKRVDPLTGDEFEDHEELVENDADRLVSYYKRAVSVFGGASDLVKYCLNRRMEENHDSDTQAIVRVCAAAYCMEIVQELETWAADYTEKLLDEYGPRRFAVSEENLPKWNRIDGNTKPYIERNLNIQASVTRQNMDYDRYPKHIICDDNGWAYINLFPIEKRVVETELAKSLTVAWYRNQPRNLHASLCIPYEMNGELEPMYPDFIFFEKLPNGTIARSIVDPHGDWLGDSIAKLKGYVSYLKDHPDMFASVQVVTGETDGELRYLDLKRKDVQDAIESFIGSSAKSLFNGALSRVYAPAK